MADKPKASRRRGFTVDGETLEESDASRIRPRSVDDAFRLANREDVEAPQGRVYPPNLLDAFLEGRITLGDLEGITKQEQYQMAEIGHGYLSQGKLDEATIVFKGLLALDPFDAYFNMALGSIAHQQDRLTDAERHYTRAVEINPFSASAHANRGELRVMQGQLQPGIEDLVKAIELDPKEAEPATQRARATLMVLRDQLSSLDTDELRQRAEQSTGSRVPVEGRGPRPRARGRGRARGAPRPRVRARARRPGARRPGGPRGPRPRGPRGRGK